MPILRRSLLASAILPIGGAPGVDGRAGKDGGVGAPGVIRSIAGVSEADITLADIGAQPSTVPALFPNGAPALISDLMAEFVTGRKFGLRGDASDQTAQLNHALAEANGTGKKLRLMAGAYGVNPSDVDRCLTAPGGVSIVAEGRNRAIIFPMDGVGPQHSIFKIAPKAAVSLEFMDIEGLLIYPAGADGHTKRGGKGLHIDTTGVVSGLNLAALNMRRVYFAAGNDYSVYIVNDISKQSQGAPSNSLFDTCFFFDGFFARGVGDSNRWANCVFQTTSTTRNMIDIALVDTSRGGNGASVAIFDTCNVTGLGAIVLRAGRRFEFRGLNSELGNTPGSTGSNGALIDILGDLGRVHGVKFTGGLAALFGDTAATRLIRIGNAQDVDVDGMELSNGTMNFMAAAIEITADATDTHVGWTSSLDATRFAKIANDAGMGTRGVIQKPTLAKSWSNLGSGYDGASFQKDRYGRVTLDGLLSGSGIVAGGVTVFTLPAGFRPAGMKRCLAYAIVGGPAVTVPVDILPNGAVVYNGPAGATQLALSGVAFQTPSFHTSA
ncbi:hypothetical protein [Methylobacterium sp. PvR107]|uniref:hypothetical protein n=1 Tax=Methylobacterium sp. PvR107 TaxID=2806597 RepID=UPI001AE67A1F|nr:hypothetical protein [Methylobacterium sp. PvR107]MBP1178494.1 hypothetical protein [Methylobacterium sp. PvR107]